jgi:phosphoribosylanthranilate isomerase
LRLFEKVMTKVKICGITNYSDAAFSISCGADFLGFIFTQKSKRVIAPRDAKKIIARLPRRLPKVGVFVDEKESRVKEIAATCGLDHLQFHGDESPGYCSAFAGYRVIKSFRVRDTIDCDRIQAYPVAYFLFDTFDKDAFGGTGKVFDWGLLKSLKGIRHFFVSGGLNTKNVATLIDRVHPFAVDVASGVERRPGVKDLGRVKKFIQAVKGS